MNDQSTPPPPVLRRPQDTPDVLGEQGCLKSPSLLLHSSLVSSTKRRLNRPPPCQCFFFFCFPPPPLPLSRSAPSEDELPSPFRKLLFRLMFLHSRTDVSFPSPAESPLFLMNLSFFQIGGIALSWHRDPSSTIQELRLAPFPL